METQELQFKIIHCHAAGIDVDSRNHMGAVDQNKDDVREFDVYTKDHQDLISYLVESRFCHYSDGMHG